MVIEKNKLEVRLKCEGTQECYYDFSSWRWKHPIMNPERGRASSQGRDTITIGIINNTAVWGISLPENYSQHGRSSGRSNTCGERTARITSRRDD